MGMSSQTTGVAASTSRPRLAVSSPKNAIRTRQPQGTRSKFFMPRQISPHLPTGVFLSSDGSPGEQMQMIWQAFNVQRNVDSNRQKPVHL